MSETLDDILWRTTRWAVLSNVLDSQLQMGRITPEYYHKRQREIWVEHNMCGSAEKGGKEA